MIQWIQKPMGSVALIALGLTGAGCGLEALFHEAASTDHQKIVSVISGSLSNDATQVRYIGADGSPIEPLEATAGNGAYELVFEITGSVTNGLLEADEGARQLKAWLPELEVDQSLSQIDLDATSTAKVLLMQAAMSAQGKTRQTIELTVARNALTDIDEAIT